MLRERHHAVACFPGFFQFCNSLGSLVMFGRFMQGVFAKDKWGGQEGVFGAETWKGGPLKGQTWKALGGALKQVCSRFLTHGCVHWNTRSELSF